MEKLLKKYEDIKDTKDIKVVIAFLESWNKESEDSKDENPLFCINGLEFLNFQSTDGTGHIFTLFRCKWNEQSFDFDTLLQEYGFNEYLKNKNIDQGSVFLDSEIVGILYNETIVNDFLNSYEAGN